MLAGLESPELMDQLAEEAVRSALTVRQLEKLAAQRKGSRREVVSANAAPVLEEGPSSWGESAYREVELCLREVLGRKVEVRRSAKGGVLEIEFYSKEDLTQLAGRIVGMSPEG